MAGFTIDGNVSSTWCPYTFPLTSVGSACGAQAHPWSGNSNGNLQQQYFKSGCRADDGRSPIAGESIDFGAGDPTFDTNRTTDSVTQSVTPTFNVRVVTEKFFKATIEPDPIPCAPRR